MMMFSYLSKKRLSKVHRSKQKSRKIRKVLLKSTLSCHFLLINYRYKSLKNGVKSMETSIDGLASLLEHFNNLLLMSDPILSAVAFASAFFMASMASFFLCFISPNTLIFLMGLALFSPDDAVLRSKVLMKEYGRQLTRLVKRGLRAARRAQILGLKGPPILPGDFLHRLPLAPTLSIMKQHELSGFLYSKTWPTSLTKKEDTPTSEAGSWSSRWWVLAISK